LFKWINRCAANTVFRSNDIVQKIPGNYYGRDVRRRSNTPFHKELNSLAVG